MNIHTKALCLSAFVCPGAGQLFLNQKIKGSIFVGVTMIALLFFLLPIYEVSQKLTEAYLHGFYEHEMLTQAMAVFTKPHMLALKGGLVIWWIISCFDVWLSARRANTQANRAEKT